MSGATIVGVGAKSATDPTTKDNWRTPQDMIDDAKFLLGIKKFGVDVCCSDKDVAIKDSMFCITESINSLTCESWLGPVSGKILTMKNPFFCNPPFSQKYKFFDKAVEQVNETGLGCLFVMPYEPVSRVWRRKVSDKNCLVYVPDSRYHYLLPDGSKPKHGCNFPSCLVYIVPFYTSGAKIIDYKKGVGDVK